MQTPDASDLTCFECTLYNASSDQNKAASMQEQQAQAEEEARLTLLTDQAGMKLTLTQQVHMMHMHVNGFILYTTCIRSA